MSRAFEGRRIVVTGGSGFLAAALMERLSEIDCALVCISRSLRPALANNSGNARREGITGDIRQREFWGRVLPNADFVFHFAAQTSVYEAERDPAADWQANVEPMRSLLDACREHGNRPFILFSGSATQCGVQDYLLVDDSLPDRPVTVYDRHKLEAEGLLEDAVRGSADRGILYRMMRRALHGEALTLYGDGAQLCDYLHVDDAIDAFIAAAACAARTNGRHFVLGTGEGRTLAEAFALVARRAERLTGRKTAVVHMPPPRGLSPIEDRSAVINASRFRSATGWAQRVAFAEGIDRTLAALRAMPAEVA